MTYEIHIENNRVTYIQATPDRKLTMRSVVDRYGAPEYVYSRLAIGPDGQYYRLEVYYPGQGLAFQLLPSQKKVGKLTPDILIRTVEYFAPGNLMHYLTLKSSCFVSPDDALRNAESFAKSVRSWTDFGEVEVITIE